MDCQDSEVYIFSKPTTYSNDYQKFCPEDGVKKVVKYRDEKEIKRQPYEYTHQETLTKYKKGTYIPFNLYHYPKEILTPRLKVETMQTVSDPMKNEIRKTRPRLYISPGVPVDDVDDEESRKVINKYVYTTVWGAMSECAHLPIRKRPEGDHVEATSNDVKLTTELYEPLPESIIKNARDWDDKQERYTVDPTAMFWIHKDPPVKFESSLKESPVTNIVPQETKDTITKLLVEDKLRGEHDLKIPGYGGYIPLGTDPLPLEKKFIPITNPFLTVSQCLALRKQDLELYKLDHD